MSTNLIRSMVAISCAVLWLVTGCRQSVDNSAAPTTATAAAVKSADSTGQILSPEAELARQRLDQMSDVAKYVLKSGKLTEIIIQDGSSLTADDMRLFGKLSDLKTLQIFNCRSLNDALAADLSGLTQLTSLALTNSVIGDATVRMIAASFPQLTQLDLSSNTNMTHEAMKSIAELTHLKSLTLVQTRFNDLSTRRLKSLTELTSLDLRGNMEAGNMTLGVVGQLPKLTTFKHRSTAVTDEGLEQLSQNVGLQNLLLQDFLITDASGQHLAGLKNLRQLEIFRCQSFGSVGAAALQGLRLERLTLRDLPAIDDQGLQAFSDLPNLRRLYLHELEGVTDEGLLQIAALKSLELLDIWSVPQMSDRTLDAIADLPNLKELSIRSTSITDAAIDKLLKMTQLQSLTLKENGQISSAALQGLTARQWTRLVTD
ncbi:MAG: hypothetical protein KF752_04285 [Pirellulaceae bacterium]|nr:hypothetical protein [Pirellulaceae bacterium]